MDPHEPRVVATKLLVPRAPQPCIVRPRLLDALDAGAAGPVTLLCAPAGAGKTALLSTWLAERSPPGPVSWLSVDGTDDEPAHFWGALHDALERPAAPAPAGRLHLPPRPAGSLDERFLPALVNALAAGETPRVLVLDDLHELSAPAVLDELRWLLRHAPEQLRVVLATRADPALRLARSRASGALTELRAADLAFTLAEAGELYATLGVALDDEQVAALWSRTEGWAAGVRLAALSLVGHERPADFVAAFAHDDQAVAAYLVSEVLERQPPEVADFLLRTCVADELDPELADALTGGHGAATMLERLEATNTFVTGLDGARGSYRCHQMLRDLLRARLRHTRPAELPLLHRRAARWFAARGRVVPALRHALEGGAWEQASALVAEHWLRLFASGESGALRELVQRLPPALVDDDPELAAAIADSRLEAGDLAAADACLAAAEDHADAVPGAHRERFAATLAAATLHRARLRGQMANAVGAARDLLALADAGDGDAAREHRCVALAHLGAAELWWESRTRADEHLEEALALAYAEGYEHVQLDCLGQLAVSELARGRLSRTRALSAEALALAERRGWSGRPEAACAQLAGALVAYQGGDVERADALLAQAQLSARAAEPPVRLAIALAQSLALAAGGPERARAGRLKLLAARRIAQDEPVPDVLRAAVATCEARALVACDELAAARRALAAAPAAGGRPTLDARLAQALVELRAGAPGEALAALDGALDGAPHVALRIEAHVLCALAHDALREPVAAHDALERALACAEAEPYRVAFLSHRGVRALLARHAASGTAYPDLLAELLDRVGDAPPSAAPAEALTERERAVLRLLPTMLTHAEIAAELYVSVNTVKTHVRGIYRKLGATRRADAVERARSLQLLSPGIARTRLPPAAASAPWHDVIPSG